MRPHGNSITTGKVTFPWGHQFAFDETAASDAALVGTMLAGSVSKCLRGVDVLILVTLTLGVIVASVRQSLPPRLNAKMT